MTLAPRDIRTEAQQRLDSLAKPQGSLGALERLAIRLCETQSTLIPETTPRRLVLFAGDHGVVADGVGIWPQAVTRAMVDTIARGRATSSALAATFGADVRLIDVGTVGGSGVASSVYSDARVGRGSASLAHGPALTPSEFSAAWAVGAKAAREAKSDGVRVVALGEIGIGNTTPAAAITAYLTGRLAHDVTGTGAGATAESLARKQSIVATAVERARQHDRATALASLAGFEIAAMAGFIAEASKHNVTVVIDGFVVTAAALTANALKPDALRTSIAAHVGAEPGHRIALDHLGLEPFLEWQLRLGEGTGALLLLPMIDAARALLMNVATLDEVLKG